MKIKAKNIALTGLMAAVICVISVWQIPLPFGVPMTFQTFAVSLSGYILGKLRGTAATFTYAFLGAIGLPLFTGFQGGLSVLLGPSGGFITGFLILSLLCGFGAGKKAYLGILFGITGLALCHIIGIFHFSIVQHTPIAASAVAVSLPYFIKDIILTTTAYFISIPIRKNISIS